MKVNNYININLTQVILSYLIHTSLTNLYLPSFISSSWTELKPVDCEYTYNNHPINVMSITLSITHNISKLITFEQNSNFNLKCDVALITAQ